MARCSSCSAPLPDRARFCAMCGRPVQTDAAPSCERATDSPSILPANYPLPEPEPSGASGYPWLRNLAIVGMAALVAFLAIVRFGGGEAFGSFNAARARSQAVTTIPVATPTPALPAYEQLSIDVPAGGSYSLTFGQWQIGTVFEGYLLSSADQVGFRIQQPDGGRLMDLASVSGRYDFHIVAPEVGLYVVTFMNGAAPESEEQLTLVYRAYVLGTRP